MSRLSRTKPGVLNSGQYHRGTWGATVPGTYPTPEAGTCTPYVHYSTWGLGASRPAPSVRTQRGRPVRAACTYPTEAPGRTCQLRSLTASAVSEVANVASRQTQTWLAGTLDALVSRTAPAGTHV